MNNKLKKIIEHYGVTHQLKYFQSEVYELNESILCPDYTVNDIAEEIADVMVMLKQFQLYYDIGDEEIKDIMEFKINRQIERINDEKIHSGTN